MVAPNWLHLADHAPGTVVQQLGTVDLGTVVEPLGTVLHALGTVVHALGTVIDALGPKWLHLDWLHLDGLHHSGCTILVAPRFVAP